MPSFTKCKPFLSSPEFLDQLRKEKRRAARSHSPLSIVLFTIDGSLKNQGKKLKFFMDFLEHRTRETDIKGWVNKAAIGVILMDTDRSGLERFVELIIKENRPLNYSITKATYPDILFESLLETSGVNLNFFPNEIDHSPTPILQNFFKRVLAVSSSLFGP